MYAKVPNNRGWGRVKYEHLFVYQCIREKQVPASQMQCSPYQAVTGIKFTT